MNVMQVDGEGPLQSYQNPHPRLARVVAPMRRIPVRCDLTPVAERRFAQRKMSETAGLVASAKLPQALRCIVRNTSSTGALIDMSQVGRDRSQNRADEVPDKFTLVFVSYRERTEVACTVMRRVGNQVGVRYVSAFRTFANVRACRSAPIRTSGAISILGGSTTTRRPLRRTSRTLASGLRRERRSLAGAAGRRPTTYEVSLRRFGLADHGR